MALTHTSTEWLAARDDMIDRLMDGKPVDGVTFENILDCDIDANPRMAAAEIAPMLLSIAAWARDEHTHVERRVSVERWLRARIERWVDSKPDLIRERAAEYAREAA